METIIINDGISKIVLHLNKDTYFGYRFYNNNKVEKIDKNVFKYFDFLYPSLNYTKLGEEDGYTVILDNDTNFKHYIKNGNLDFKKFMENNGNSVIRYDLDDDVNYLNDTKILKYYDKILKKIIVVSLSVSAVLLVNIYQEYHNYKEDLNKYNSIIAQQDNIVSTIEFEDITKEDIAKMINNSSGLNDSLKKYLNNQELFEDILPYINDSNYMKYMYMQKFNEINFKKFDENKYCNNAIGYVSGFYNPLEPNTIYLRNKVKESDYSTNDTIAHEFIHLCQDSGKYENLVDEVTAEMYSYEYFEYTQLSTYKEQIKALKKLMEIIGTEPIKRFTFNGDFSLIEQSVKPYLNDEEYKMFVDSLHYDPDTDYNCNDLNYIITILYERIYNDDINNNKLFNMIDNDDKTLVRYYFNPRLINKENSYYYDSDITEEEYYSYEEAYNNGLIKIIPNIYNLEDNGAYRLLNAISYEQFIKFNFSEYQIDLLTDGYVDYDNQQITIKVPSKIYIDPIKEINANLVR